MRHQLFDPATIDRRHLPNGLTSIVREDHSAPVVAIVTYLKVGYFDEPDDLAGISHVLEHMFFKGTPSRGPGQIAQETRAAGGYLNAATIYDHTSYYAVLPARAFAEGLAIQSDALLHSEIDAGELERELQVIIQEAKRKLDNPDAVAQETLYELMFDQHRIRRWRIGTESFLRGLTRTQLWTYYRDLYQGARTVVVVAGAVEADHAQRLIEEQYSQLAAGIRALERGPAEAERSEFRFREQSGDIMQSRLELGWHTRPSLHEDTAALDVLAVVLGQGRASRLYRNVREAGLVSSIAARNYTPTELGVFEVSAELEQNDALPALQAIAGTMVALADSISDDELERARSIIEARALRRLESMEGQANHLAEWEALGGWQLGGDYLQQVGRLQAADLHEAARKYLDNSRASVFLYRPSSTTALGWTAERLESHLREAGSRSTTATPSSATRATYKGSARPERTEDGVSFFRTGSGGRVVVKPRRATPLVSIAFALPGGASLEPPEWAGCSALMARASIKGSHTRSAAQLALASEALGASIHPRVAADLVDWSITVPSHHFATALELLLDPACSPSFPDEEIEKEKKIALADLQQLRDDMVRYPLRLFLSAAFPDHPYGFPIELTERAIPDLSADDLRSWHHQITHQAPATVLIVGDVDGTTVADAVAGMLTSNSGQAPSPRVPVWPAQRSEVSVARQKAQSALALGFPGVDHRHPDSVVLHVLANTIGGLGGRLFEELRSRRGLAYMVSAYPISRALAGAFIGYIAFSPEREAEARRGLLEELGRVREELLPATDVQRAQRYTIGAWQIRLQTNGAQLGELMHALLIGRGLEELRDFEERVNAVTPQRIRDAAQRYFAEEKLVEAIVRGTGGSR